MAANPPIPMGVMAASEPPAIMTSAAPRSMILKESPIAWAPAEQAVAVAELGPAVFSLIETCPAARFAMLAGIKKGEIFRGPFFRKFLCSCSMVPNPPIPEPIYTPTRCEFCPVILRPELQRALSLAAIAYSMNRSILRAF